MPLTLDKASILVGAILGGVTLGYFLRDTSPDGSPAAGRNPPRPPESVVSQRDVRPMAHPAFAKTLSMESQERLHELETLAASDPRKALTRLPAFRDTELLPPALTALAKGWAQTDPQAAAQWAAQLESAEDQVSAALGLVPVWATKNPEQCLAWASAQAPGNMREVSLVELADTWVAHEPGKALGRFLSMKSEDGTERGLHAITAQWALDDPDAAIEHIAALDPAGRRDEFLETALVSLTNQDPDRVWSEATRFDDLKRVEHVRAMSLEAMAETRPQGALKLAASVGNPPALLEAVTRGWASWDAPAAKAWIATLTDAELAKSLAASISGTPEPESPEPQD